MADQNKSRKSEDSAGDEPQHEEQSADRSEKNSEWLRDQTGEDHNLSGSSTYRTLPDQPEDKDSDDSSDRQSNQ